MATQGATLQRQGHLPVWPILAVVVFAIATAIIGVALNVMDDATALVTSIQEFDGTGPRGATDAAREARAWSAAVREAPAGPFHAEGTGTRDRRQVRPGGPRTGLYPLRTASIELGSSEPRSGRRNRRPFRLSRSRLVAHGSCPTARPIGARRHRPDEPTPLRSSSMDSPPRGGPRGRDADGHPGATLQRRGMQVPVPISAFVALVLATAIIGIAVNVMDDVRPTTVTSTQEFDGAGPRGRPSMRCVRLRRSGRRKPRSARLSDRSTRWDGRTRSPRSSSVPTFPRPPATRDCIHRAQRR